MRYLFLARRAIRRPKIENYGFAAEIAKLLHTLFGISPTHFGNRL
jgi:hypothetical protein